MLICFEMGLKPREVKLITLREFYLMHSGYKRREEKLWEHTRYTAATIINYGGMGAKKLVQPKELIRLELDKEYEIKPIRTIRAAQKLLKEFEH